MCLSFIPNQRDRGGVGGGHQNVNSLIEKASCQLNMATLWHSVIRNFSDFYYVKFAPDYDVTFLAPKSTFSSKPL